MFVYDRNEASILLRFANEKKVDLIALAATSKRIELTWWSAGKTVEKLIRDATCSVFCVRGKRIGERDWKRPHFRHVLLLTGLEGQMSPLLQRVLPLVDRFQSVLHVFPLHGDRLKSSGEREALRQLCQIEGTNANVLFFTEPKNRMQNLLNFLRETPVELIVMTPDTRAEFSNRLVSDILIQLLRLARCPVLLLR
jgi:nucleotide-binding universal stress UspA family protein